MAPRPGAFVPSQHGARAPACLVMVDTMPRHQRRLEARDFLFRSGPCKKHANSMAVLGSRCLGRFLSGTCIGWHRSSIKQHKALGASSVNIHAPQGIRNCQASPIDHVYYCTQGQLRARTCCCGQFLSSCKQSRAAHPAVPDCAAWMSFTIRLSL